MNTFPFLGSGYTGVLVQPLTLQAGGSAPAINFDRLFKVEAYNGGARLWYRTVSQEIGSFDVTETPAAIAALFPIILLTQVVGTVTYPAYYPIGLLSEPQTSGSGATINVFHGFNGTPETITVTQTKAAIIAAIEAAAAISGGGGGTTQSVTAAGTTQGTATATTSNNIRITGGGAGTGIALTAATAGERAWVKEATGSAKRVYPASGGFIDERAVNIPYDLPAYGAIELVCTVAGKWDAIRELSVENVTGAGISQITGPKISAGTDVAIIAASVGNTSVMIPAAQPGKRILLENPSAVTALAFPQLGQQIGTLGVDAVLRIPAGATASLACATAGTWLFAGSRVQNLWADQVIAPVITEPSSGAGITLQTSSGTPYATVLPGSISLFEGLNMYSEVVNAAAGFGQLGATQLMGNVINIQVCASAGDSVKLMTGRNWYIVTNSGANSADVFGETGYQVDGGGANNAMALPAGDTYMFSLVPGTQSWIAKQW